MSLTLTATVESLHIAAAQKLMELLQTEKDPSLLARLIATALRFKLPRLTPYKNETPPTPPPPPPGPAACSRPEGHADNDPALPASPTASDNQHLNFASQCAAAEAAAMRARRLDIIAHLSRRIRPTASAG